jgi:tetratricopeptide (TPR) repeat protein
MVLGAAACLLAWRILTLGVSDAFVDSDPTDALAWRANDPEALAQAATEAFQNQRFPDAKALALRSISNYPLDGRGYRVLADVEQFFHHEKSARELFVIANRLSPRDFEARSALADYDLKSGNVPSALRHLDILLRVEPRIIPDLLPKLGFLAADSKIRDELARTLQGRPPWRQYFLAVLADSGKDPAVIDAVFAARGSNDPIPAMPPSLQNETDNKMSGLTEADLLIKRQITDRRGEAAYATGIGTLSSAELSRLGNVYDGGFDFPPKPGKAEWLHLEHRQFGWQIPVEGTGFDVTVAPRSDFSNDNVLRILFNGLPLDYHPVRQLLVLPSGNFRLTGYGQSGAMNTEDGVRWQVICIGDHQDLEDVSSNVTTPPAPGATTVATLLDTPKVIGKSRTFGGDIPWGRFTIAFAVPPTDCAAQWLQLDVGASIFKGEPLEGGVLFDSLSVERVGDTPAAPEAGAGSSGTQPKADSATKARADAK